MSKQTSEKNFLSRKYFNQCVCQRFQKLVDQRKGIYLDYEILIIRPNTKLNFVVNYINISNKTYYSTNKPN
jgi:hypothetical protein